MCQIIKFRWLISQRKGNFLDMLCLVTYMRQSEGMNQNILQGFQLVRTVDPSAQCIIFVDEPRSDLENYPHCKVINYPGTKYARMLYLFQCMEEVDGLVSLDNDMICAERELLDFIKRCDTENIDIAWGKIRSQPNRHFVSRLVAMDKLLSHDIIRPFLWHINCGISIPGQCFYLKTQKFSENLYQLDTFLDDLALGTYVSEHKNEISRYISKEVLGFESPHETFQKQMQQRKRWARGYYDLLSYGKGKPFYGKILIHAMAYHGSWLLQWVMFWGLYQVSPGMSFTYFLSTSVLLCRNDLSFIPWAMSYQLIFPIFHLVWWKELLKGGNNNVHE